MTVLVAEANGRKVDGVVDWARGEATPARSEQQRPAGYPESLQARRRRGIGISAGLFSFLLDSGGRAQPGTPFGGALPHMDVRTDLHAPKSGRPDRPPSSQVAFRRRRLVVFLFQILCVLFRLRVGVAI